MLFWQLSVPATGADSSVVVVEKGIESCSVDKNVLRVDNSQGPGVVTPSGLSGARGCKVGVSERFVDGEWSWSTRIWLIISVQNSSAQTEFINSRLVLTVSLSE
jgi:hypothetical protein